MGKNYLICRPKIKSVVSVWTDPKNVYRGVVSANQQDVPDDSVRILTLPEKEERILEWRYLKHSSI